MIKNAPAMKETRIQSLDWKDSLEKGMVTHFSILPEEFHGQRHLASYIQFMGLQRVSYD